MKEAETTGTGDTDDQQPPRGLNLNKDRLGTWIGLAGDPEAETHKARQEAPPYKIKDMAMNRPLAR